MVGGAFGDTFQRNLSKALRMKIVIRNFTQHLVISLISWGQWLIRSKIVLFSFFMSRHPGRYLSTRSRIGGVSPLLEILTAWGGFYDVSRDRPLLEPLEQLLSLFEDHKNKDSFYSDISLI